MYVDFKIKTWGRIHIPEGLEDLAKEILEKNPNISSESFLNQIREASVNEEPEWENLYDTEEDISLDENEGYATVEAFADDDKREPFWKNGK